MQVTCEAVDASQLLRDILQSKEHFQAKHIDNNNSSSTASSNAGSGDIFHNGGDCNSEMISPLLHSKSSDMAYNDRDNDTEVENDNDIDVTVENGSVGASDDESDLCDRSYDNPKIGGAGSDSSFNEGESKEAKRAHVENILSSMKQSPRADSAERTGSPLAAMTMANSLKSHPSTNGEIKRQKRKQPQPQQHDTAVMDSDEMNIQSQMEYMQAMKRKRKEGGDDGGTGTDLEDNADDEDEDDDDDVDNPRIDDGVRSASLPSGQTKRARVEHILSAMRSPPPMDQELIHSNGLSPSMDGSKKQKRKQTQPQQHENSKSSHRDFEEFRHSDSLRHDTSKDDGSSNSDDGGSDSAFVRSNNRNSNNNINNNNNNNNSSSSNNNRHSNGVNSSHAKGVSNAIFGRAHPSVSHAQSTVGALAQDSIFSANLLRGLHDKEYQLPFHNGFDPHHMYRENLFRHGLFGIHHDLDPMAAAYRGMARGVQALSESETQPRGHQNLSPADVSKITEALKSELNQVVSKTIDKVVNKVLSDKLQIKSDANKDDKSESNNNNNNSNHHQQQPQHQLQQQHPSQPPQLKIQSSPILPPQFPLHPRPPQQQQSLLQQPQRQQQPLPPTSQHQQQSQQQQHQQQQQQQQHSSSHATEREALKETVNNSQVDKKPELIVPFSDHLHFLERYGNRHLQEKISAFEPLHKPESDLITPHTGPSMAFHPPFPYYLPTQVLPPLYTGEPEQTEALPLIVNTPKKKRTKVTDTRLTSPRSKPSLVGGDIPCSSVDPVEHQRHLTAAFPHFMSPVLQTSVAITNPSLTPSDLLAFRLREAAFGESRLPSPQDHSRSSPHSPSDSPHFMSKMDLYERASLGLAGSESMDGNSAHMTTTLTPMHLRKAKLMFFYTRYPSSAILKMYFPDVLFNKNNTAQLVKWFSNFREFFYIQMEKYARQALAEGCKHQDDLAVTTDSELFRHLNLHYNRNNQLQVPENFHHAVEAALKEFFKAIQANKDVEPSWKKAIYKIIARMDETLPEFFKSVDWMGQLNDQ